MLTVYFPRRTITVRIRYILAPSLAKTCSVGFLRHGVHADSVLTIYYFTTDNRNPANRGDRKLHGVDRTRNICGR